MHASHGGGGGSGEGGTEGGDGGGRDGGEGGNGTKHRVCSGLVHSTAEVVMADVQHAAPPPVFSMQPVPPH